MAVLTTVDTLTIRRFLERYNFSNLQKASGLLDGVENTNYLIETENEKAILTLFERRLTATDIPYFVSLMQHLHAHNIPCPLPFLDNQHTAVHTLKNKPALLVSFLQGHPHPAPSLSALSALGTMTAKIHLAGQYFPQVRSNGVGSTQWPLMFKALQDATAPWNNLVRTVLPLLMEHWPTNLPAGVCHADLFPDNVFFKGDVVSGVIDWYFACTEFFAYDIAIVLNAWSFDKSWHWQADWAQAILNGYETVRALLPAERAALPLLCQGAALRFLLTRWQDAAMPRAGEVTRKDPAEYATKLAFFSEKKLTF
ncbi:MAG: homoserine kinase [Holosporales bacterium]|jgi:homoserine kinase type II